MIPLGHVIFDAEFWLGSSSFTSGRVEKLLLIFQQQSGGGVRRGGGDASRWLYVPVALDLAGFWPISNWPSTYMNQPLLNASACSQRVCIYGVGYVAFPTGQEDGKKTPLPSPPPPPLERARFHPPLRRDQVLAIPSPSLWNSSNISNKNSSHEHMSPWFILPRNPARLLFLHNLVCNS